MAKDSTSGSAGNGRGGGRGGGRQFYLSKKHKRPPQRGLGVAELERMRLEEQRKKAGGNMRPHSLPVSLPLPHHHRHPLPSSAGIQSPFSPSILVPTADLPLPPSPYNRRCHSTTPPSVPPKRAFHSMWDSIDFYRNSATDSQRIEPMPQSQPNEFNPLRSPACVFPLKNQNSNQQQPSSMMTVSSSRTSSCGVYPQMEPPSNQILCSSHLIPPWHEEDRVVGMKRSWPFSVDETPQFHYRFSPFVPPPFKVDACNTAFRLRESFCGSNNSIPKTAPIDGKFLTLAPPAASLINTKSKQFISVHPANHSDFDLISFQASLENPFIQSTHQPFYSFLPVGPSRHEPVQSEERLKEGSDHNIVDLNLKL